MLHPIGTSVLKFEVGPHTLYHPVVICKDIEYSMIIGVDVLRAHKVSIPLGEPDHIHFALDK